MKKYSLWNSVSIWNQEDVLLLKHVLLYGKLEYGSPVRPQLLEAEVLHHIDLLDATITMMSNALDKTEPGAFSERVFGLDNRSFINHYPLVEPRFDIV